MRAFAIKRGDTSPSLVYALLPVSVVLTGANAVFNMRDRASGATVISRAPAVIVTPTGTPTLRYDWQPGNIAAPGSYEAEFEVTYSDGTIETFPNAGYIPVKIHGDIA